MPIGGPGCYDEDDCACGKRRQLLEETYTRLMQVHCVMDKALGDTDLDHFESDEQMKDEAPYQWCAMKIMEIIRFIK